MSFIYDVPDVWNDASIDFTGIGINVTNGNFGGAIGSINSRLLNLLNNGVSKFNIDINGNIYANFVQNLINASNRSAVSKWQETISIGDFGGVNDGTTNNYDFIIKALTSPDIASKELVFGPGIYFVRPPTGGGNIFSTLQKIKMSGKGRYNTNILLQLPDNMFYALFALNVDDFEFCDIGITVIPFNGGVGSAIFNIGASNICVHDCLFNGGVLNTGPILNTANAIVYNFPNSGTQDNLDFYNNIYSGFTYPFLKTNASTSTQNLIKVYNSQFHGNYNDDIGLNSPNGTIDNVLIFNNNFYNGLGVSASLIQFNISLSNIQNFIAFGNISKGIITEFIHIEGNTSYGVIANNNCKIIGQGMLLVDNNISGTYKMPNNIIISNNNITYDGVAQSTGTIGIQVVDINNVIPVKNLSIFDNNISNFERNIIDATQPDDDITILYNKSDNALYGISSLSFMHSVRGNHTSNCVNGYEANESAIIYDAELVNCTNLAAVTNRSSTFQNVTWRQNSFAVGAGASVDKTFWSLGANERMDGILTLMANMRNVPTTNTSLQILDTKWDGATFVHVANVPIQEPGGMACIISRVASLLNVNTFNGNISSQSVDLELSFIGTLTKSPTFTLIGGTDINFNSINRLALNTNVDPGPGSILANQALKTVVYTLASLPTPTSIGAGSRMYISDCTLPVIFATASGGGATSIPVYCDGNSWKCG